jgi:hypothetical protein
MYNEEIAKELKDKYGNAAILLYCKMESLKNRRQAEQLKSANVENWPNEFEYEASWWENKLKELQSEI